MANQYLLIDANNLMYSVQYGARKLTAGETEVTSVFGVLGKIRDLTLRYPKATPIVLWDSSPSFRADIYPEYKAQRKDNKQVAAITAALRPQRPILKEVLNHLGVRQYTVHKYEADDLAADLSRRMSKAGHKVILVTRDGDWQQLVDDNVSWFDHKTEITLTPSNFEEITGYKTPVHFTEGKIIQGDAGDNVKGVGGLGEGSAAMIMREFESLDDCYNKWAEFEPTIQKGTEWSRNKFRVVKAFEDKDLWAKYDLNRALMDLVSRDYSGIQYRTDAQYNEQAVKAKFAELGFHSILRKWEPWIEPFLRTAKKENK